MPKASDPWVLDTHIWIRLLNGDPALDIPGFQDGIRARSGSSGLRISSISLWETSMLCAKGRLKFSMPVLDWLEAAVTMPGLITVQIDAAIAADSAFLPGAFHGDPADRLITATARAQGAELITIDRAILDYAHEGWVRARAPDSVAFPDR
jgi:PIN domain nuclease of toxin-antitoxin system